MQAKWICTVYDGETAQTTVEALEARPDGNVEMQAVNLYPGIVYQTLEGFGGAVTEAVGYTWSRMPSQQRDDLLEAYFGSGGIGYRFARIPLDSCDFSLGNYSAVERAEDAAFETFSLSRDERYILPFLRAAQRKLGGKIALMLTPWSPPAFMKTNGEKNNGGKLRPECREAWAAYLCRYLREYRALGFDVRMLSIQNEPNARQTWDSCLMSGEEERVFLRDYLHPALVNNGLEDIQVFIWDHNKERALERALEVFTEDARAMAAGVAFHWYSGEHFDALRMITEKFPEKKLAFTEGCVEYSRLSGNGALANARMYAHDIIGNLNNGTHLSLDWNLLLDELGGPNHVGNYCDAPILCDTGKGVIRKNLSYTYIGHFSRYLKPGAARIGCSRYSDAVDVCAFRNPGGQIAAVLLNRSAQAMPANIRLEGLAIPAELPPDSIATLLIDGLDAGEAGNKNEAWRY